MPDAQHTHPRPTDVPSLVYIHQFRFPNRGAAWIQITRTLSALADHADVVLVVGSLTQKRSRLDQACIEYFGRPLAPRIKLVSVRRWLRRLSFPLMIRRVLAQAPRHAALYTRSVYTAEKLIAYRSLHKRRVIFESHAGGEGFLREDAVANSRYAAIRDAFESDSRHHALLRHVYSNADTVFFLHQHCLDAVKRALPLNDADALWYGFRQDRKAFQPTGSSFVFCGLISEHKLIDLLLDAFDLVKSSARLAVYGGNEHQASRWREKMESRPCADRIAFHSALPYPALQERLRDYRFGLATQEGMKVVDYIENGVTPIVPDIPSYRDVFDERHVIFYRPDDPVDLARTLDAAAGHVYDPAAIRELCERYSLERRAEKILARL